MILDMDTLYRIHSNEHSRYVTVRAHQHRHRPAPTPLANAQETIDFSLTLSGYSRLILNPAHSYVCGHVMSHVVLLSVVSNVYFMLCVHRASCYMYS